MSLLTVVSIPSIVGLVVIGAIMLRNQFAGSHKTNV